MIDDFALNLKVARRKAGLRQRDSAHLLEIGRPRISKFESGQQKPSVCELCALCIAYGCSLEALLAPMLCDVLKNLPERLATMPGCMKQTAATYNRQRTLDRLAELADQTAEDAA